MKYTIYYEGFAEVEADSIDQAEELFWRDEDEYREYEILEIKDFDEEEYMG